MLPFKFCCCIHQGSQWNQTQLPRYICKYIYILMYWVNILVWASSQPVAKHSDILMVCLATYYPGRRWNAVRNFLCFQSTQWTMFHRCKDCMHKLFSHRWDSLHRKRLQRTDPRSLLQVSWTWQFCPVHAANIRIFRRFHAGRMSQILISTSSPPPP